MTEETKKLMFAQLLAGVIATGKYDVNNHYELGLAIQAANRLLAVCLN